jgi:hypothetical protein
MASQWKRI